MLYLPLSITDFMCMSQGNERPSICATLINEKERNQLSEIENVWTAATL